MKRWIPVFCLLLFIVGCETTQPMTLINKDLRLDYLRSNPHLPEKTRKAIRQGQVIPGMTKDQVLEVWGEPHWRGQSRWEYKGMRNIYVLFNGDLVKSVNFYT